MAKQLQKIYGEDKIVSKALTVTTLGRLLCISYNFVRYIRMNEYILHLHRDNNKRVIDIVYCVALTVGFSQIMVHGMFMQTHNLSFLWFSFYDQEQPS